jgi:hypothetical protein
MVSSGMLCHLIFVKPDVSEELTRATRCNIPEDIILDNIEVQFLNINGNLTDNNNLITDSLSNYLLTIANIINISNVKGGQTIKFDIDKHLRSLSQTFPNPLHEIKFNPTSTTVVQSV